MRTFSSTRPPAKKTRASILVHGLTGTGKTTRALRGGKPLVICTEPKAEAHVLKLNPAATCWIPESCADVEQIFQWLGAPSLLEQGFTRIVLDSYTELTEALPNWILRKQAQDAEIELGRKIAIDEYRPLQEWGIALIRAIQLSGLPSIIIARSDAKKMGLIEKIVPAGLGSSSRNLSAQLVPTVEARFDGELDKFIWDSRPDEYSQRCGLLWVPPVWTGTADEFLAVVEDGEGAVPLASTPPETPATQAPAAPPPAVLDSYPKTWVDGLVEYADLLFQKGTPPETRARVVRSFEERGPAALSELQGEIQKIKADLQKVEPPTSAGAVIAQLPPPEKPEAQPAAENFVDSVAHGKESVTFIDNEEWGSLEDLLRDHKVDRAAFLRFCEAEKHVVPAGNGEIRLDRLVKASYEKLVPILKTERRRNSLAAHLKVKYSTPASTPQPATAA